MAKQAKKETAKAQTAKQAQAAEKEEDQDDQPLKKYTDGPTIKYPVPDAPTSTEETTPIEQEPHKLPENPSTTAPDFVPAIDDPDGQKDNSSNDESEDEAK